MKILNEIFYALTGALAVFIVLELVWQRVVLAYINVSWLLIFWLIIGIVIIIQTKIKQ